MSDMDKRVVQMEFDNSKFDKNVKKSTNTLSKFEEQLKFKDVSDSLNVVKKGFSAFEIAGITAISRVTNAVINLGVKMTKSLSIDQIASGWQKFGDKTIAVATLAAQKIVIAGKELANYEEKMEGINDQLEKLEWFTNETSYTFNDMVAALGKFTAAGQDLDKSVHAMEGIALWAAMSGANAQKASSAMTQLAQTLGRGYVLRIDWQSIQTLNMDTAMFREKVLETAVELGKLKKVGNEFISNTGKKITAINFTETLSSKWFTSDVLVKTLERYSAAIEDIYRISEEEGISARGVIEKYGSTLDEFAVKAFKAAQETRTLGEALTYVFGTIGSTWSKTFEKIIGKYDQAKELWSDLSDALYEDVIASNDFRNEILGTWEDLEGRADLFEHGGSKQGVFWNIYDSIIEIKKLFQTAKNEIFPKSMFESESDQAKELGARFKEFTSRLREFTAEMLKSVKENQRFINILKGLYSVIKLIVVTLASAWNAISPIVDSLRELMDNIISRLSILGNRMSKTDGIINSIINTSDKFREIIEDIIDIVQPESVLNGFIGFFTSIFDSLREVGLLKSFKDLMVNFVDTLKNSGGTLENFKRIADGIKSVISMLAKVIKSLINLINKYVLPVVINVLDLLTRISATILGVITEALAVVADLFTALNSMLEGNEKSLSGFGNTVMSFLKSIPSKLKLLKPILESLLEILKSLIDILLLIPKTLNNISKSLTGRGIIENIKYLFDSISEALKGFVATLKGQSPKDMTYLFSPIITLFEGLVSVMKGIIAIARPLITLIGNAMKLVGEAMQSIGNFLTDIVNGESEINATLLKVIGIALLSGALIATLFILFKNLVYSIQSTLFPLAYSVNNITDAMYDFALAAKIRAISSVFFDIGTSLLMIAASIDWIGKSYENGRLASGLTVVTGFTAIFISLGIILSRLNKENTKFSKTVSLTRKGFKSSRKETGDSLDSVVDFVKQLSRSMLKLAISLAVISWIPEDSLSKSIKVFGIFVGSIAALFVILRSLDAVTILINKKGRPVVNSLEGLSELTDALGKTLFKFALSIAILNWIPTNGIWKSFAVIAAFGGLLVVLYGLIKLITAGTDKLSGSATSLKDTGSAIQGIAEIIKNIGKSLLRFAIAVAILSLIPTDDLWKTMGVIGAYMAAISVIVLTLTLSGKRLKGAGNALEPISDIIKRITKSLGLLIISIIALSLLLSAGKITSDNLWRSFGVIAGMVVALGALIIAINTTAGKHENADKALGKLGLVIGMLSLFLVSFGGAMLMISNMPLGNLITGSVALIALFGMISLMFKVLTNLAKSLSKDEMDALKKVILSTLIPLSVLLVAFGASMMLVQNVPWYSMLVSVGVLAGMIATLVGLSKIADPKQMLKLAGSMLLIAPALILFGIALASLAKMDIGSVALQLLVMAGALLAFGLIGKFLGDGLLVFSLGALALATSLLVLSLSLALLSTFFVEFCNQIVDNSEAVKGAIIVLATSLLTAFVAIMTGILQAVIDLMPLIVEAIGALVGGIAQILIDNAPKIFEAIKVWVLGILNLLIETMPQFFEWLNMFVGNMLTLLINNTPKFLTWLGQLVSGLLSILINNLPKFFELLTDVLLGILQMIVDVVPELLNTVLFVIKSLIYFVISLAGTVVEAIFDFIITIIDALARKVPELIAHFVNMVVAIFTGIMLAIPDLFMGLLNGIIAGLEKLVASIDAYKEKFRRIGELIMEGLRKGLLEGTILGKIVDGVKNIGNKIKDTFCNIFGIHSPSRVFAEYGNFMMMGLANGISDSSDKAVDEIEDASDNMKEAISKIYDYVSDNVSSDDMVLKPVLDLSDVNRGVGSIRSMMGGISGSEVSVTGNIASTTSRGIERSRSEAIAGSANQNAGTVNEGDNYYSTFNISTNDPEEFARQADTILQKLRVRANLAKGGAR